ncbi:MAG TPA: 23S rRNA (pseudouridine(1915)-N(3))-methyltransferase RlmH [Desulfotomaculum sp.]|nr:23S rRNA (pseudouridine(1915)-N(3))-methyltransferase RlmH [Desulfotomaculum sp.]
MHINLLCVGRLGERYLEAAQEEYCKRLQPYTRLEITEVRDEPFRDTRSRAVVEAVLAREGERLLRRLPAGAHVLALDRRGTMLSSEEFAALLGELGLQGKSRIVFVIGGALGLSGEVLRFAAERLSFSRLTFPHQLMRILLLEQIYRAFKINRREPYHH